MSELRALKVGHIELEGESPCLVLPGAETKNRQEAAMPLRQDLARDLEKLVRDRRGWDPVLPLRRGWRPPRMIRSELAAARPV